MRKRRGQVVDGWLLLDKSVDISSNHALKRVKHLMDAQKAGHTGTLDPFATGLLVCCFGRATKIAGHLLEADKSYTATVLFGQETDSGDRTGVVVDQAADDFVAIDQDKLLSVLPRFAGVISQVPPMTSALKHQGRPLYAYAREGITIERPPREVTIYQLELLSCSGKQAVLQVSCSKGTYIRTLAQDIGRAMGVGAHLTALRRDSVGPFALEQAQTTEQLIALEHPLKAVRALSDLPESLAQVFLNKGTAVESFQS